MKIQISSLSDKAIERCNETFGETHWKVSAVDLEAGGCKDVLLATTAILKVFDDDIVIDVGGHKEFINECEFYRIEIF